MVAETDNVVPPAIPTEGVAVPDPSVGGKAAGDGTQADDDTGHEAFEKAKAETEARK